jgi:hypothetical protein
MTIVGSGGSSPVSGLKMHPDETNNAKASIGVVRRKVSLTRDMTDHPPRT